MESGDVLQARSSLIWCAGLAVGTLVSMQEELSSWALRPFSTTNHMTLVQATGRAVSKCIPHLNKTTNVNAHFFTLFLNTFENTEISHAQRHNSRSRKIAQSLLFCPSFYAFHVALIIKGTKVWSRTIQLNYTPLPDSEKRNFKLFYLTYYAILRQKDFYNFKGLLGFFSSALMRFFFLWEFSTFLTITIPPPVSLTHLLLRSRQEWAVFVR